MEQNRNSFLPVCHCCCRALQSARAKVQPALQFRAHLFRNSVLSDFAGHISPDFIYAHTRYGQVCTVATPTTLHRSDKLFFVLCSTIFTIHRMISRNSTGMLISPQPDQEGNKLQRPNSNFCKPLKNNSEGCPSNQLFAAAMTSGSDEKWRAFNCFFSRVGLRTYQHPYITVEFNGITFQVTCRVLDSFAQQRKAYFYHG